VRSRDDLPPFAVELVYVAPTAAWTDAGKSAAALPALDLPISRTAVELHYSPRYRVTSVSNAFRPDTYTEALSPALKDVEFESALTIAPDAPAIQEGGEKERGDALKALVKQFQEAGGGRAVSGVLPVDVPFPQFGAVMFLATELTPETHAPVLQLEYHRTRGN
jgi:hypothetical protein